MPWYSQFSWCGDTFNGGNCRRCTNMSFGEEFVRNPDPISNDETPEFSYPPPQPQYESNSCEKCGNDSHYGYDCSPRFPLVYEQEPCYNQNYSENYYPQNSPKKCIEREQAANLALQKEQEEQAAQSFTPYWNFPIIDDDDDEYTIQYREYLERSSKAITPDLSTEEPDNSLSMGDEHLSTIPETESDKLIKSSVEDLVPIPSESEGIFDNMCDVPSCDKKHFDAESDLMESLLNRDTPFVYSPKIDSLLEEFAAALINPIPPGIHEADFDPKEDIRLDDQMFYDYTLSDDDYFEDIDYIEASPPDSELVSIEEVEYDILRAKLSNNYLLIAKIESLNDNPTLSFFSHSDNSLPEFENFSNHTEETRSGSTTTHAKNSLPEYDSFHFEIESDQGELFRVVMETIDEIDAFLDIDVSMDLEDGYHDSEGDIIYLESLLIKNTIPNLSPKDCPDFEGSRAQCFVHRPLDLQSFACLYWESDILNLID
ncbi:hypothetical protein Tco_1523528 [Tanacetum coccineum]